MFASKDIFLKSSGGYQISRSVRLRSSASAYFNRTPSASSRTTWTWAAWVKRGKLGSAQVLFSAGTGTAEFRLTFTSSDTIEIYEYTSPSYNWQKITTAVYRDPSAWYQIQLVYDTTNGTAADRVKLYVNGVQVTSFGTNTNPTSSFSGYVNSAVAHGIGSFSTGANYLDGYLTEINFIDGQALTPSSFGETNAVTGVWQPKRYAGTYGTNGFYLNFSDNSGVTATTIGKDYSGNGNNWTPSAGISITAGVTYDSMLDVPTPYADGGNGRGNYAVLSPLGNGTSTAVSAQLANANLRYSGATSGGCTGSMAIPSGTYYFEATLTTIVGCAVGLATDARNLQSDFGTVTGNWYGWYVNPTITLVNNATTTTWTGNTISNGTVVNVAIDTTNPASVKLWLGKANVWYDSSAGTTGNPATGANPTITITANVALYPVVGFFNGGTSTVDFNFGQRPFTYTPPTGFVALNTQNLPTPTISNGANYMAATIWTGDATTPRTLTNTVNGVSFQPDLVWGKNRSDLNGWNVWFDSIRGGGQIASNSTDAELSSGSNVGGYVSSYNSNGFTVTRGSNVNFTSFNASGNGFVAWQWNAGGSTVTNTSGTISSQVRANPTAGFSVVTYTGTGANATVGHGLNATPAMIIVKNRDSGAIGGAVYHTSLGATKYLKLFQTTTGSDNEATDNTAWNGGSPTFNSSVFSVGSLNRTNSSQQMVAYCFAAVSGYSAFGKYTGNGNSTDGPFVYCGFRPRFVMVKSSTVAVNWLVYDTARDAYNVMNAELFPSTSGAEVTASTNDFDFLSNGFKCRRGGTISNQSGETYIYMAFAENPFKNSLAR